MSSSYNKLADFAVLAAERVVGADSSTSFFSHDTNAPKKARDKIGKNLFFIKIKIIKKSITPSKHPPESE
jgi:hypothetical protein